MEQNMTIRMLKILLLYVGCIYGCEKIPIREENDTKTCIRKTSIKYNNRRIPISYNPDTMVVYTNPGMNTIFRQRGYDYLINLLQTTIELTEHERTNQ